MHTRNRPKNVWFRQYGGDYFQSPEYRTLSDAEFRLYHEIIALAVRAHNENDQINDGRTGCTIEDLATMTGRTAKTCNAIVTLLKGRGMIKISENFQIFLENFSKFFPNSLDSAKRVRRHREKKRGAESGANTALLQLDEGFQNIDLESLCNVTVTNESSNSNNTITKKEVSNTIISNSNTTLREGEKTLDEIGDERAKVFKTIIDLAPNLMTANSMLITDWLLDGCSAALDIIPTVERLCAFKKAGEIKGFRYFDAAIRQSKAERDSGARSYTQNKLPDPYANRQNIDYVGSWKGLVVGGSNARN
jgi:hypothetical protein